MNSSIERLAQREKFVWRYAASSMTTESEVFFEITVVGGSAKVVAVHAATGIEVSTIGPANASRADLQRLALGVLNARLARTPK